MCLSKSVFILRSNYIECDRDLPIASLVSLVSNTDVAPTSTPSTWVPRTELDPASTQSTSDTSNDMSATFSTLSTPARRKICQTCSHTYEGDKCIICIQNEEYEAGLQMDLLKNDDETNPEILDLFDGTMLDVQEISPAETTAPNIDDLREIRINVFSNNRNKRIMKINQLKIKTDLIKAFQNTEVSTICQKHLGC